MRILERPDGSLQLSDNKSQDLFHRNHRNSSLGAGTDYFEAPKESSPIPQIHAQQQSLLLLEVDTLEHYLRTHGAIAYLALDGQTQFLQVIEIPLHQAQTLGVAPWPVFVAQMSNAVRQTVRVWAQPTQNHPILDTLYHQGVVSCSRIKVSKKTVSQWMAAH